MSNLTNQQVDEHISHLREKEELPSSGDLGDALHGDLMNYYCGLVGNSDLILHEINKTKNRKDVFDYFARELENSDHTVRRIQDIAEDLNKRPDAVHRAISPLVGLVYMRPFKIGKNGDLVDCYPPVVQYLKEKRRATKQPGKVSSAPRARAIMTVCTRHKYEVSDYRMTNGLEAIYSPELIDISPNDVDVRVSIDTDSDLGHMQLILRSSNIISDHVWNSLKQACRIQTRAIINRMTYDPDERSLLGSEYMTDVVKEIAPDEECSCGAKKCTHFAVLPPARTL